MITRPRRLVNGKRTALMFLLQAVVFASTALAEFAPPRQVAPGVWFLEGDPGQGYANTVVIEMRTYLIVVDGSYPGRVRELLTEVPRLSPKPIKYAFMTHHHGDHAYGNSLWTRAGVTTLAYVGVRSEMDRYEPTRWQTVKQNRDDMRLLPDNNVEPPKQTFRGRKFVLRDGSREVDFLFLGWAHTRGDGYAWLPKERILCTGDAVLNGPRNKLWDANIANWPRVIKQAEALHPALVLPGHGAPGGVEMMEGQARFLRDLRAAVADDVHRGLTVEQATEQLRLPPEDANWIRRNMTEDVQITYTEIKTGKPAGALPHTWR